MSRACVPDWSMTAAQQTSPLTAVVIVRSLLTVFSIHASPLPIIVLQVKDMFNEVSLYKGNALRVLSSIVDTSMLGQLERYYKQVRPMMSCTWLASSQPFFVC